MAQAAFKGSSLDTGNLQESSARSLNWDEVKDEDKTLVHQVHTCAYTRMSYIQLWQCKLFRLTSVQPIIVLIVCPVKVC